MDDPKEVPEEILEDEEQKEKNKNLESNLATLERLGITPDQVGAFYANVVDEIKATGDDTEAIAIAVKQHDIRCLYYFAIIGVQTTFDDMVALGYGAALESEESGTVN